MDTRKDRSRGITRASTDGPRIIPCSLFSPKRICSSTDGSAAATAGQHQKIRLVRADSGFFDDQLLSFLEQRPLPYIVVARLTKWIKREAQRVEHWKRLDEGYSVGEFHLKLLGWQRERRFVVVREVVREGRDSVGRKLIDVPGYAFRIFVTTQTETHRRRSGATTTCAPIWRTGSPS